MFLAIYQRLVEGDTSKKNNVSRIQIVPSCDSLLLPDPPPKPELLFASQINYR